jgi:hypothetical protein
MRSRLLSIASTLALTVAGTLVALTPAGPASAHCSGHGTHPDMYNGGAVSFANGTRIHAYPHIDCATNGLGYPSHGIDVHCYTYTNAYWIFVRNTTTGVAGWARLDALNLPGSEIVAPCPA